MVKSNHVIQLRTWAVIPILAFVFIAMALSVGGYFEVKHQRVEDCKTSNEDRQALRDVINGFFQPLPINPTAPPQTQEEIRIRNERTEKAKKFALAKFQPRDCGS